MIRLSNNADSSWLIAAPGCRDGARPQLAGRVEQRTAQVLIDRDAVQNGTAAAGEPWQYYDLGHGYCSYTFFE